MRKHWCGLSVFTVLVLFGVVIVSSQIPSSPITVLRAVSPSANISGIASPEEVGLSSERLERIGETIERSMDAGRIAGAVSLVARHGRIAYFKAFGMADREAKKPMRTDNILDRKSVV